MPKAIVRENMLKSQVLTGHVLEPRVLAALAAVARENFVPDALRAAAYVDQEIALGEGRFLMGPLNFARFLKYADIGEDETVLDIACGNGYSSAVLSRLARRVVAVEEAPALAQTAAKLLAACPNVAFRQGALAEGASAGGPYDVILIEGAIEQLPQALADQLREGGRLLAVEHDGGAGIGSTGLGTLVLHRKVRGTLYKTILHDTSVALIPAFGKPQAFAF